MAIYHLRLKLHSRGSSKGIARKSIVASAAYRSGERLYDMAQGIWYAYEKPDVIHTEILCPDEDALPEWVVSWVKNRQSLWNRVEASEIRKDAQLAREVEITLPRELSKDEQIALVRGFVRDQFVSKGMVADIAIHCPIAADGLAQPHAHILLALRRLDYTTQTGFSTHKERDWNEREDIARAVAEARKRYNNTGLDEDLQALETVEVLRNVNVWRERWAAYANDALEAAGEEARIDHRTLEKQGIFRLPQIALGIARHVERAYDHLKDRITQWVAIKKRAALYDDVEYYRSRDPVALAEFVLRLADIAETFAASFRKSPNDIPEVDIPHDR